MESKLLFDIETDNLYDDVSTIHCIVTKDLDNEKIKCFTSDSADIHGSISEGLEALVDASHVTGHNIIGYDNPVLTKLRSIEIPIDRVTDTLVLSRLYHTELKRFDYAKRTDRGFPRKLAGSHSMEAWGQRLGRYKGMKPESFEKYTPKMLTYCIQDVELNHLLLKKLEEKKWSNECVRLEHEVAHIIQMQEKVGIAFNVKKAQVLYAKLLTERTVEEKELLLEVPGWWKDLGEFTPKVNNKKRGYVKGCVLTKLKWIEFNPRSRPHLIKVLKENYGWKPTKFTKAGNPTLDDQVLTGLSKIANAQRMLSYLTISKRISQLAEGKGAWFNHVTDKGIIHGRINSNGAITGRMSHYSPNLSQVPAVYSPYGEECRELFTVRAPSNHLVGADADGLELRCLAHYLYKYDGGKYADAVLYGSKEKGTDAHSLTLRALGELCKSRADAKTFFYALIYGAQDYKLGSILTGKEGRNNVSIGRVARKNVETRIKGLGKLRKKVLDILGQRQRKYKRKWLTGIDGRKIYIRSDHAALNSLLQSAGGIIMKKALVILYDKLCIQKVVHGEDYSFVINSHDEWQVEVYGEQDHDWYGKQMVDSMTEAGEYFKFKVPITGEYKVGKTWKETH